MSQVLDEMKAVLLGVEPEQDDLAHIGMPRRSGRYPWGSGEDPYQHGIDFLGRYEELKKKGMKDVDIARELNMLDKNGNPSTGILRLEKKYAHDMRQIDRIETAKRLRDKEGLGPTEIGRRMGVNESTVRGYLDPGAEKRAWLAAKTADYLREQVDEKKMIDITSGTETDLGISKERLKAAVYILEKEGYHVYSGGIPQPTNPGHQTTQKVLCTPEKQHKDIYNYDQVKTLTEYTSDDGGATFRKLQYPASLDSKRLKVLLRDDVGPDGETGVDKDGLIQIRRGVKDLSLGTDRYSQVRILVDNDKYLKGMAVYSDNMPDGVDVIFNSNKTSMEKALKPIKKDDPMNPFGALISPKGQSYYEDENGNKKLSLINKTKSEGDWSDWTDALPAQFLSKQPLSLIKRQLNEAKDNKMEEYKSICELTNPVIKKHLLEKFADGCDAAAVDLKAAALPGQKYHAIIPINTLKDTEVYAPRYEDGTKIALIRYPHAGTFEIPVLKVNNKHASARKILEADAVDAIAINKKIAEQLSGADFDGDTVMCIPTDDPKGKVKIARQPYLKELVGFDPQEEYPERKGMKYMKDPVTGKDATQSEMGKISNLITDMTLFGAPPEDVAKAVKHSMVVIDAGKHKLDYTRSYVENDIDRLKKEWQVGVKADGSIKYGGAATLISRSKGEDSKPKTQGSPKYNLKGKSWYDPNLPEGAKIYKEADDLYYPIRSYNKETGTMTLKVDGVRGKKVSYNVKDAAEREMYEPIKRVDPDTGEVSFTNKDGSIKYKHDIRKEKSTKMANTDDANTLVSTLRHPTELAYADYANSMKALANTARKEFMITKDTQYNSAAKKIYQAEVDSLNIKLNNASINSIKERAALRKANVEIANQREANPNMEKSELKKLNQRSVTTARADVGSISRRERNIEITDKEWEAIQAGAISATKLRQILNNTDIDALRERAMPKTSASLTDTQVSRVKRLNDQGYTLSQIASKLDVSVSTITKCLEGDK